MPFKSPPKKHLGQHFLKDRFVIQALLDLITPSSQDIFIEIGPGRGALTLPLLATGAKVYAIELDQEVIPTLQELASSYPGFKCIHADAITFDYGKLCQTHPQKVRVIGNLPYNVSTPILFRAWEFIEDLQDITVMLQKEVVKRMVAKPGDSHYGRLAMMTQYFCEAEALFVVPPQAFLPPPKVDSQFLTLKPRPTSARSLISPEQLSVWVKRLFQFPRKTVNNNLKKYCEPQDLEQAGINPRFRPQEITLEQLIRFIQNLNTPML